MAHVHSLYNRQFLADVTELLYSPAALGRWGIFMISDMEAEAADCRRLAAKFKLKAQCAWNSANKAAFLGLERRYLLLALVNEREAEKLRIEHLPE
jgi:hypothetical protein